MRATRVSNYLRLITAHECAHQGAQQTMDRQLVTRTYSTFLLGLCAGVVISTMIHSLSAIQRISWLQKRTNSLNDSTAAALGLLRSPLSHDELGDMPLSAQEAEFKDELYHKDDESVSQALAERVRVLCWVMTSPGNLDKKTVHVRATWARRCNHVLYVSDHENATFPTVNITVPAGRSHLTMKTMLAFDYVYKNYRDKADWFMKTDDDTYVVVENLRYMLSAYKPTEPIYFGHHFGVIVKQGYFSGGAGYVLSREALNRFVNRTEIQCRADKGAEDVEIGRCMENLGVKTGDSRDALGRTRFHCFDPETHFRGGYPNWYYRYDKHGAQRGTANVSDYPITFHYIPPFRMYELEYYIYHVRAYGVIGGLAEVNTPDKPNNQSLAKIPPKAA